MQDAAARFRFASPPRFVLIAVRRGLILACRPAPEPNRDEKPKVKVSVIGMGAVGTAIVGSLVATAGIDEIVCLNRNRARAEGEVLDFRHTASFTNSRNPVLRAGDDADLAGSGIVVLTAGAQIREGESRDTVLSANHDIVRAVAPAIERYAANAVVLVVTNPVDVVTQLLLRHTSLPKGRVISLGTVVDTARLMRILGERLCIDPKNVFAYVLGDHSETAFIPWSIANICGTDVDTFCRLNDLPVVDRASVRSAVTAAGHEILRRKGNTNHGIAASVCRIIRAIDADERSVLPVGTLLAGEYGVDDVVMSVPCVVGRGGVQRVLRYAFTSAEMRELHASERHVRDLLERAG